MIDRTEYDIMRNWGSANLQFPLVSVRCLTYNHQEYIEQALDGFLMQETDFPFEVIVHDDASDDDTAGIIRIYEKKYPNIVKPIYETENQWRKDRGILGKIVDSAIKGKYIAFCEGDDYWIDSNKLQMQVSFLETHPEYGMCYTKAKIYAEDKKSFVGNQGKYITDALELIKKGNHIPTNSACVKKEIYDKFFIDICPREKDWLMMDYPLWLYVIHETKIFFFDIVTGVYRILKNSASHFINFEDEILFETNIEDIRKFYANRYGLSVSIKSLGDISYPYYINEYRQEFKYCRELRGAISFLTNKTFIHLLIYFSTYHKILYFLFYRIPKRIMKNIIKSGNHRLCRGNCKS